MKTQRKAQYVLVMSGLLVLALLASTTSGCARQTGAGAPAAAARVIPTQPPAATAAPALPASDPGAEAFAYPGATLMEYSDEAQEACLDSLQTGCTNPPIRTPDGTRGIFYATTDSPEQIKVHYDAALAAAGWTFVREWLAVDSIVDSWSKGAQRVDMAYLFDFSEASLTRLREQFGMDIPPDHRLIVAWPWEAE